MVKKDALLRKANIKKKEKKNNNNFSIKFVEFSQNKASRGLVNTSKNWASILNANLAIIMNHQIYQKYVFVDTIPGCAQ